MKRVYEGISVHYATYLFLFVLVAGLVVSGLIFLSRVITVPPFPGGAGF